MVSVELGGDEENKVQDLRFFSEMRRIEGDMDLEACRTNFLTPICDATSWLYGHIEGVKVGQKGGKLSPTKYPPDCDIFWGLQLHSCKVCIERIMAGPLLLLQVAGRLPPLAGQLGVKRVKYN